MINIVIPMAGAGSRFSNAGYSNPKPLIELNGIPMIKLVVENLKPSLEHKFIFICQKEHVKKYNLKNFLKTCSPNCEIVEIDGLTEGAACTVLEARNLINNSDHLMIANSDQYIDINIDDYLSKSNNKNLDGIIMTMKAYDSKWSFVGLKNNRVGGKPILSLTINLKTVESEIAKSLSEVQNKNKEVEIGSYPFFRAGKLGVSIVIRSENQSKIDSCNLQILKFVNEKKISIVDL